MLVEVIAKRSQDIPWQVSIDGISHKHDFIRRVSMDRFYALVTGDDEAFKKLCEALPSVLDDVLEDAVQNPVENSVFGELQALSPNLLKSLYLLAFSNYNGFDTFDI